MRPRGFIIISALILLSAAQQARPKPEEKKAPIADHFAKDWLVAGNDTLVYSRSFNRRHEFGYVTCSSADQVCRINVVRADSTDYRARSCGLRYDLIQGRTGDMALYLPDDGDRDADSEQVVQAWWLKAEDASDTRITALQLRSCMNAGFDITPVAGHPSQSRVVAYGYPSFDLVYSDAFRRHEKRVRFVSFAAGKQQQQRAWSLQVDQKYMYEERGVEDSSSRGFFYLSTDGEPDWRVRAMYANSSSAELKKLGIVEHLRDPTRTYPKSSGAHRRYGLCWKNLDRDDDRVNCTQFKTDGRRSIGQVSLNLVDRVDWLAVHNLEEPAMLLVTGKCDEGKCNEFSVTKIDTSGRKYFLTRVNGLDAECPTAPFDLSMDVVEEVDANLICFNFVCLATRYKESTAEKANTTLQYRRHCIDGNFVKQTA